MEPQEISFASVYNFVTNFKPEEIDDVINDFERKKQGFTFLYAVDTYDIVSHYLPYTDGGIFQNKNKNELSQKLICYDYFFSDGVKENKSNIPSITAKNKCIIVLQEYRIELLSAKNKILRQLKDVNHVIQNLDFLKQETVQFTENSAGSARYFEKNFEILLLLLILSEKKEFINDEFENFLRNRLSVSAIDTGCPDHDDVLNQLFSESINSPLNNELFDLFVENNKYELISIEKELDRFVYLENTFRDVQAIDRILYINDRLRQADQKYQVLYLSSAPFKTKELFRTLHEVKARRIATQEDKKHISINRNIYQCFLYEMLSNEFYDNEVDISKALYSLRKVAVAVDKRVNSKPAEIEWSETEIAQLEKLKIIFDGYSSSLENHFYIKIYEKYKELYHSVTHEQKSGSRFKKNVDLLPLFTLIDKFLRSNEFQQKYFDFNFTISWINDTIDAADSISRSLIVPDVLFGKDIIKNSFHHLPHLLFLFQKKNTPLLLQLPKILNNLIDISYPDHPLIPALTSELKNAIDSLVEDHKDFYALGIQQVMVPYISMITSRQNKANYEKEVEVIERLENQRKIFNHLRFDSFLNTEESKFEIRFKPYEFTAEINYILLWLYRRNDRIPDGIELGKKMIHDHPEDPRCYHGLALCYISLAYTFIKEEKNATDMHPPDIRSDLKHAYTYLRLARERYEIVMEQFSTHPYSMLIMKNYMAVLNSMADISIRLYEMEVDKDFSRIEEARKFIAIVKELCGFNNLIYNHYPVFNGTELEIEYYEAKELFELKKYGEAHLKILNALQRKKVLETYLSATPIDAHFLNFSFHVQDLFTKIYAAIQKPRG